MAYARHPELLLQTYSRPFEPEQVMLDRTHLNDSRWECLQQVLSLSHPHGQSASKSTFPQELCIQSGMGGEGYRKEGCGSAALWPEAVPRGPPGGGIASWSWRSTQGYLPLTTNLSQHATLLTSRSAGLCEAIKNQRAQGLSCWSSGEESALQCRGYWFSPPWSGNHVVQ